MRAYTFEEHRQIANAYKLMAWTKAHNGLPQELRGRWEWVSTKEREESADHQKWKLQV